MDTSKHFFQLHGVNAAEKVVLRKKLRRKEMVAFFKALAPTVIGIEACGAAHYLARLLGSFGHEVKLIAPQLVKPYVKRGKNDGADAEALCEAMSRPSMRFVPVKTAEQQAALMMVGLRDRLIRNCTQLSNAIRGYAAEFGFSAAKGKAHLVPLLERIQARKRTSSAAVFFDVTMPSRHVPDSSSDQRGACLFEIVASRLCGAGKPTSPRRQDDSCQPNSRPLDNEGVILSRSQPLEGHCSQPSFRGRPSVTPKGPLRALVFASPRTCTTPIRRRHTSPQTHQRRSQ
jgi:hypothetical protein